MKSRVCFFLNTNFPEIIDRSLFYKIDVKILKDLGFDVEFCLSFKKIPSNVSFYFIWWWTYAIFPVVKSRILKKKSIITGTFNLANHIKGADFYSRPFYQKYIIKKSARLTDTNILVSKYELDKFKGEISGNNVVYSPHVLEINKYFTDKVIPRQKYIFTMAWMSHKNLNRKCIPEILRAACLLRERGFEIKFKIGGKVESDANYIYDIVYNLNLQDTVEFLGILSENQKINYFKSCSIYLQPTLYEGFGLAIAEALLCGTPVITSKVGAVPEVTNNLCSYIDGKDANQIANIIVDILDRYKHYLDIAQRGKEFVAQNYNYTRRKNDFEKIFQKLNLL